ncbi:flagellar hook-length control protein FliK [Serratia proteamaculans]|uniref:flagellar hook-length control protein FliK n=1 Tax=Serratia proteamaculans TaxID=28151 RepID=UPI0015772FC7|nr:flagellar hook-length control protein FliK [Serratia proteamaculans]NTX79358.1 flagellar hook-length control protein FliK [Serratia proteamaculans]NTZ28560.1 flagellar hook-length control protein FliK [Serratia proteamaculans]
MNLNLLPGMSTPGDSGLLPDAQLPLDESSLSSAFAQLLGARVLPADKAAGKLSPMTLSADEDTTPLSRNQLTQLLATFGERDGLLAPSLLTSGQQAAAAPGEEPLKDQTEENTALRPAGEIDAATLQALFAMLPIAVTPVMPATAAGVGELSVEGEPGVTQPTAVLNATLGRPSDASGSPITDTQKTPPTLSKDPLSKDSRTDAPQQTAATDKPDATALKFSADTPTPVNHLMAPPVSSPTVAAAPASSLVTAPPTPQLNAQLGSPEWQQALNQQVLMFHRNGQQSAELRLHPQELGALQITLKLDDSQAQLHIASAHGQVRAAVEAAMPQLRHALAESGINLGQSSVGSESMPQGQQAQQQNAGQQGQPSYRDSHAGSEPAAEALSAPQALQAMARAVSGVDIFA